MRYRNFLQEEFSEFFNEREQSWDESKSRMNVTSLRKNVTFIALLKKAGYSAMYSGRIGKKPSINSITILFNNVDVISPLTGFH